MLPTSNFGMALITFKKWLHKKYWVHNPESEWAYCNCSYVCGKICKHQIKVFQLFHLELAEGTIAHYYGALKGTVHGGFQNLLNPTRQLGNSPCNVQYTPPTSRSPKTSPKVDLEDEICCLQFELLEEAQDNKLLMEHLFSSNKWFCKILVANKKHLKKKFKMECYILLIRSQLLNAT
jgi:hypothetical protein